MSPAGKIIDLITKRSQENFKQIIKKKKAEYRIEKDSVPKNEILPQKTESCPDVESLLKPLSALGRPFSQEEMVHSSLVSCHNILLCLAKESSKPGHIPKFEEINIVLRENYAVLELIKNPGRNPFRIVPESEDFVAFRIENKNRSLIFDNFGINTMNELLKRNNGEYVRGVLNCSDERRYVTVLPSLPGFSLPQRFKVGMEIEIPGSLHCGHAFIGDIVLVQIIDPVPVKTDKLYQGMVRTFLSCLRIVTFKDGYFVT